MYSSLITSEIFNYKKPLKTATFYAMSNLNYAEISGCINIVASSRSSRYKISFQSDISTIETVSFTMRDSPLLLWRSEYFK